MNIEDVKSNPQDYEIRIGYYGGLAVTSEMLKILRFDLEMKNHYRKLDEDHRLLMYALKLGLGKRRIKTFSLIYPLVILAIAGILLMLYK